jgi:ribosomal protein S18 acetylase RimI-like enzyme
VRTVFGTRGDPSTCWCQYFKLSGRQWREATVPECEAALHEQSEHDPGPGLLAYEGDEPVGWVAVEPRTRYSRLQSSTIVKAGSVEPADDTSVWAITCFVVRVGFRRRGVGTALLAGALEHAQASGARVVEAYPVDTTVRQASAADLYHGVLASFVDAGFEVAARPIRGRAVVRYPFTN